jgi:drug/metabolite transporter (DMT)-like permease
MAIGARELAGKIDTLEVLFLRSAIGLALVSALILSKGQSGLFKTTRPKLHLLRNAFHFVGQYGWFIAIGVLPLAQVFALEFTTPLWTLLVAALVLKESLTLRKSAAILLGFIGTAVILNPGRELISSDALSMLGAAVCFSLAYVCMKSLSSSEHPLTILFYMFVMQLPVALALSAQSMMMPSVIQWGWIVLIAITALSGHFCIANAISKADASIVVTLDFLRLPLIIGVGVVLYAEPFNPLLLAGAVCMLGGNLINLSAQKS